MLYLRSAFDSRCRSLYHFALSLDQYFMYLFPRRRVLVREQPAGISGARTSRLDRVVRQALENAHRPNIVCVYIHWPYILKACWTRSKASIGTALTWVISYATLSPLRS